MRKQYENVTSSEDKKSSPLVSRRALLFGGAAAAIGGGAWWGMATYRPYVGKDNTIRVPYTVTHQDATPIATSDAGQPVYQPSPDAEGGDEKMPVLDDYTLYAPEPAEPVHEPACEADANKITDNIPAGLPAFGWSIPSLGVSARLTPSGVRVERWFYLSQLMVPVFGIHRRIGFPPQRAQQSLQGMSISRTTICPRGGICIA